MSTQTESQRLFHVVLAAAGVVALVRIAVLVVSPLQLYPDEAQYWWWAQTPAFGYFSKPPLIAWIVWLTTAVFGNAEWAVRLASPILHSATSLVVFGIARCVFPGRTRLALWSALAYLTTPGVSYSSGLISTDVPLLFCWALALYAFLRAQEDVSWRWVVLCGAALGVGMLAKYAMLYFVLGAVVAAFLVPKARRLVFGGRGLAILAIGLLLFSPNIFWNAAHGFPTVTHTEANADWGHSRFSVLGVLGFIAGQFGVFGPLLMAGLAAALWRIARQSPRTNPDLVLAAFCVPPLILMFIQSFISEANANWAATAYIAATPLAVDMLRRWGERLPLRLSLGVNSLAMVLLWIILVAPSVADTLRIGNAFKREEGWREFAAAVGRQASGTAYDAIATDNRSFIAELLYYIGPQRSQIRMWSHGLSATNHFEMTMRLMPGASRVLLVVAPEDAPQVLPTFDSTKLVATVAIPIGGHKLRVARLYDAHDYRGPQNHS
jgi:4-amino-4-deoxy-L-arabinose transferase-like glycosyltransferase